MARTKTTATTNKGNRTPFQLKYCKATQEFIVDKIEEGLTLAEIAIKYGPPDGKIVPNEKTLHNWKKKYPQFKAAVDGAYQILILKMVDEMHIRSKEAIELSRKLQECLTLKEAKLEAMILKGQLDAVKMRLKAIEFTLNRIAPKLVPEFAETSKNSAVAGLPPITIKQYFSNSSETTPDEAQDENPKKLQ